MTDRLYRNGIDIRIAKIATKIDQVIDIFYVRTIDGEKVDDPVIVGKLKSELSSLLYAADEIPMDTPMAEIETGTSEL